MKNKRIKKQTARFLALTLVLAMVFSVSVGFTYAPEEVETKINLCDDCVSDMALDEGEGIAVAPISCDNCGCGGDDTYCEDCTCGGSDAVVMDEYVGIDESEDDTLETGTLECYSYDLGMATYQYDVDDLTADNDDIMTTAYSPSIAGDADVTITASVQYPESADGYIGYMQVYYLGPDDSTFSTYGSVVTVASEIDYEETYTESYELEDLEAGMHKVIFKFYSSNDDVNAVYTTASTIIVSGEITEMSTIASVSMTSGEDKTVSFTHSVNGDLGTISYVWFLNNTAYDVTSDPEIVLCDLSAGIYTMFCQISPAVGLPVVTNSFTVTVGERASYDGITVVSQPSNVQVKYGETVVMSVSLMSDDGVDVDYAWSINDTEITDSNTSTISFTNLAVGQYSVYCDVSVDEEYSFTTDTATITVSAAAVSEDTDSDVVVEDEEESAWTKVSDWFEANQTLAIVLVIAAIGGVIYLVKRR